DAHDDVTAEATNASGAIVIYDAPAAHDVVDADSQADCSPASGSVFALGTTVVTCTHVDAHGNPSTPGVFNVTVQDTTPPTIDAHDDESAEAANASGAVVAYTAPLAHDLVDDSFAATCAPASGSLFAIGSTVVTCHAQD